MSPAIDNRPRSKKFLISQARETVAAVFHDARRAISSPLALRNPRQEFFQNSARPYFQVDAPHQFCENSNLAKVDLLQCPHARVIVLAWAL